MAKYSKFIVNKATLNRYSKVIHVAKSMDDKITRQLYDNNGLYQHDIIIKTGDVTIKNSDLDVTFDVPFDDDAEANEAVIEVYNLTKTSILNIKRDTKITITAGYKGDTGVIFSGYISKRQTGIDGIDRKTTIWAIDSQKRKERKIKKKAYKKGVKASYILKDLITETKLPMCAYKIKRDHTYKDAVTVDGELMANLKKYAQICGVSTYINKGKLYVRSIKDGDDVNFVIEDNTGLLGVEEFEEEQTAEDFKDDIKGYKISMLLCHRITTASVVQLKSREATGKFRVRSGSHSYDGSQMLTEIEVI